MNVVDLGLSYEEALHGVQTAIKYAMENDPNYKATDLKHLRVGIDSSKAEMAGLAMVLIMKGFITIEEYTEALRLHMNNEVAMRQKEYGNQFEFR